MHILSSLSVEQCQRLLNTSPFDLINNDISELVEKFFIFNDNGLEELNSMSTAQTAHVENVESNENSKNNMPEAQSIPESPICNYEMGIFNDKNILTRRKPAMIPTTIPTLKKSIYKRNLYSRVWGLAREATLLAVEQNDNKIVTFLQGYISRKHNAWEVHASQSSDQSEDESEVEDKKDIEESLKNVKNLNKLMLTMPTSSTTPTLLTMIINYKLCTELSSDDTKSESVNDSDDSGIIVRTIVFGASFPFWESFSPIKGWQDMDNETGNVTPDKPLQKKLNAPGNIMVVLGNRRQAIKFGTVMPKVTALGITVPNGLHFNFLN
ncbi:7290_t:CDS:2, partial [Gigaspora margarita]